MNPHDPRCIAHFNAGQQHPVERNKHRNLHHDRKATTHRVDFFFFVNFHHGDLHLLRPVFKPFSHLHDLRIDRFHLGHAGISFGIEPVKSDFQQQDQGHDGPAPVMKKAVELIKQPIQRLGQNGQPAVILDQLQSGRQGFQNFFFLRSDKEFGFYAFAGTGCNTLQRRDHAGGVKVVVNLAHEKIARQSVRQYPG